MFDMEKKSFPANDSSAPLPILSGVKLPLAAKKFASCPSAPRDSASGVFFLRDALRRWWKWAVPTGLILGLGAAAVVYWLFVPYYEAVYLLKITSRKQPIAFDFNVEDREASRMFVNTQIELLRHRLILGPVLADPRIARMPEISAEADPLQWLARQVSMKQANDSELYRVAYAAPSAENAAAVVNAVVKSYLNYLYNEDKKQEMAVVNRLNQALDSRASEVKRLRGEVRDSAIQSTGKDPYAGNLEPVTVVNHPLTEIQNLLVKAEVEQEVLKARLQALKQAAAQPAAVSETALQSKVENHSEVARLKLELMEMRAQLRNLDSISARKERDPSRQQLTREIGATESALEQLRKYLRESLRGEMQAAMDGQRTEIEAALRSDLEGRRITSEMLRQKYENEIKGMKQSSGDTLTLRLKQGELERAEKIEGLIAERIVKLRTESEGPNRVLTFSEAEPPKSPVVAFPLRNVLLAALGGLCFPFALVLGWEKIARRVGDAANLETEARHRVLGEIARLPSRRIGARGRMPQRMGFDLRMFEESVDSLRTTLMLEEDLHEVRILAITSAINHEGKTSIAAQLAMSLERATDRPILLIDGDTRAPDMHTLFDVPLDPGLIQVLEGNCTLEEAIVPVRTSNLDLLPAGKLKSNPHQLFGNGAREALRRAIPEKYRYVIIDTPPILAASEALMLAAIADASVLCTLRDVSRIDQVRKAYERLQNTGGNPVGLVLSGVPTRTYASRYGSYGYERVVRG
ncbi:MAG: polysaccharide biosynthesis tyrosine autokinase [Pirellulales bacterium]|nr:polysaccharide biosynthesis tyrosine autokinase [Pirellulales bacterium]